MASKATTTPARQYDPEQLYEVQLLRTANWNGLVFSPGQENQLKGKICQAIDADIADARIVANGPV